MTGYPIMSYVKFDPLAKVAIARSLIYKGTILSSAFRKELMGQYFGTL